MNSTRNAKVGEIYRSVDCFVLDSFEKLFTRLKDEGRIAPKLDIPTVAQLFSLIGDGMFWRRAIDPAFEAQTLIPGVMQLVAQLLNPVDHPPNRSGGTFEPTPSLARPTNDKIPGEPRR